MLTVFVYIMTVYGIAAALVYYGGPGDIISKFRNSIEGNDYLNKLFSCMFCLPTNIGFIMSILSLVLSPTAPFTPFTLLLPSVWYLWPLIVVFDGFFTGACVSIIDTIVDRISTDKIEVIDNSKSSTLLYS